MGDQSAVRLDGEGQVIWRLVVLEVAVAITAVASVRRDWTSVVAIPLALLVVLLLIPPIGRRVRSRVRFLFRRTPHPVILATDAELAALCEVVPGLSASSVSLRSGLGLGVLSDGAGWSAVLALRAAPGLLHRQPPVRLPMDLLAGAIAVDDIRLTSIQVLTQTSDNPLGLPAETGPIASYQSMNAGQIPGTRQTWIVLRVEPDHAGDAIAARGGGGIGAERVLKRCVARIMELLATADVQLNPLSALAATNTIAHLTGLAGVAPDGMRRTAERWTHWDGDGHAHVSWRVRSWPGTEVPAAQLSDLVAQEPAFSTVTSVTLQPGDDASAPVRVRALVRLTGRTGESIDVQAAALAQRVAAAGFGLERLDGRQAPALIASLPMAAVAPGLTRDLGRMHVRPASQLAILDLPVRCGGVTVGTGNELEQVLVQLFQPAPARIFMMTASYVAKLLAYRSSVTGALVEIISPRAAGWTPLVNAMEGRARHVPRETPPPPGTGLTMPLLRCEDAGLDGTIDRTELGPWQTRLVIQDRVTRDNVNALRGYDLVITQRLRPDLLRLMHPVLGIDEDMHELLLKLPDDVIALISPGQLRLANLSPTWLETRLFGQPVRIDG